MLRRVVTSTSHITKTDDARHCMVPQKHVMTSAQNINESVCIPQPFWLENSKVANGPNDQSYFSDLTVSISKAAENMTCLFWAMPRIIGFGNNILLKRTRKRVVTRQATRVQ